MSCPTPELTNEIVRAGAGTGKTTALTRRVLNVAQHFFKEKNRAPKIVVTTFTRKATEELRERLVRDACKSGDPRLIDFVTAKSNLHISTIHGVLSLFLRRLGHWLDIDSGFRVLDEQSADRIASVVLREILVQETTFADLLEDFTFVQLRNMVKQFATPNEHPPYNANDLKQFRQTECKSLANSLATIAQNISIHTQNEKWQAYTAHLKNCAKILANDDIRGWQEHLTLVSKPRFVTKTPPFSEGLHDDLKDILKKCESLESEAFNFENDKTYAEKSEIFGLLATIFAQKFSDKKISSGQIEIDDLENFTLNAIRNHPEVAAAFSADWDYWLVDEFQDTSPKQVALLNALVGRKPIFLVGDPQQSIYLFRGARNKVFAEKEQAIVAAGGLKSELVKNYRSTPELLHFFNDFFSQLSNSFLKMEPKSELTNPDTIVANFCIINKMQEAPFAPLALKVLEHVRSGSSFDEFCVLARTNRELHMVAQYFESLNIPTHVHSSDSFYARREIIDILSLLKFLLNPHDNKNLIRLLRSPWFRIEDQLLVDALNTHPDFFWPHLQKLFPNHATILRLEKSLLLIHQNGVFETLRQTIIAAGLIDASQIHDSTGRRESNIWKLLSILRENDRVPGFSYTNFIQNAFLSIENADGVKESDAVAALEPKHVNLMTIHKAKGLKFKHVLLPNIGRRLSTSEMRKHTQPFVFSETDQKFTLALRLGEDRKLTHNLAAKKCFADLSLAEYDEHLRVLYVALTRAEKSVMLHWQEPFDVSSWANLLKMNLNSGIHKCEKYSYKVEREFDTPIQYIEKKYDHQEPRKKWGSVQSSQNHDQTHDQNHAVQSEKLNLKKKRISVTRLLEEKFKERFDNNFDDARSSSSTFNTSQRGMNPTALQRHLEAPALGQRLHNYFESIKYTQTKGILFDEKHLKNYCEKWFSKQAHEFEQAVKYALNLKSPPIAQLISHGQVEWGFQLQTSTHIIEGQIDLWGTINGETWIIDYKSGSAKYRDKAMAQLNLYSLALRARGVKDPIRLAIVYALDQKVELCEANSAMRFFT